MKHDLSEILMMVESFGNLKYNFTPNCLVVYPNNPDGFSITMILSDNGSCLLYFDLMQIELPFQEAEKMLYKALKGEIRLKVLKLKGEIIEWNLENYLDGEWKHLMKMDFMYWYSLKNARVSYLKNSTVNSNEIEWRKENTGNLNYSYFHIFIA